nr:4-alpha-glucanotransferase-like [Nerophis lumbriciformis]
MTRSCGLLLHPTSLPGAFPVGDLGPRALAFLDWASAAGAGWWQVLPLNPPEAISPYGGLSAFAGNPLLISPELLVDDGLLDARDLREAPPATTDRVDFEIAEAWKVGLLDRAWQRVEGDSTLAAELERFAAAEAQRPWLDDWTLFCALRELHGPDWREWPADLARRQPDALALATDPANRLAPANHLPNRRRFHEFVQLLFFRQCQALRRAAAERGLRIFGDLPIYVPATSAEVWAHRRLFELDEDGRQLAQAGVPPDYFSDTGQLWGFPLYRWERVAEEGYGWWVNRLAANLGLADCVRLDHFRAFAGYWRVPAGELTAAAGSWHPGPGRELFDALRRALGELPLVAEDLGEITPDVEQLRRDLGLPGMRVLQFGFDDPHSPHAPHNLQPDCVVYTGTHDNDTLAGWYSNLEHAPRQRVDGYLAEHGSEHDEIHWRLIEQAFGSAAETAIVPLQDVLGLGSEARMNTPGTSTDNWLWRLGDGQLTEHDARRLRNLAEVTGRAQAPSASH